MGENGIVLYGDITPGERVNVCCNPLIDPEYAAYLTQRKALAMEKGIIVSEIFPERAINHYEIPRGMLMEETRRRAVVKIQRHWREFQRLNSAARIIQAVWLKRYYDPSDSICQKRLERQFGELGQIDIARTPDAVLRGQT